MKYAFSKPAFQQAWLKIQLDTIYYKEFVKFVSECIEGVKKTERLNSDICCLIERNPTKIHEGA
jgi:hypothetical protein